MATGFLRPWRRRLHGGEGGLASQIERLEDEMERFFSEHAPRWPFGRLAPGGDGNGHLTTNLDMSESETALEITVDVPGMRLEDIDVSLREGALTIHGKRETKKEEEEKDYHRVERAFGEFHRFLTLPCEVQEDAVDAKLKDGVLTVTLPKSEKAKEQARKIDVKAA